MTELHLVGKDRCTCAHHPRDQGLGDTASLDGLRHRVLVDPSHLGEKEKRKRGVREWVRGWVCEWVCKKVCEWVD